MISIECVESIEQNSMHWWHRTVIYRIGFRSIFRMNGFRLYARDCLGVCVCILCVRAKDIECKQKHTEEQSYKSKWWHFSLCALGCCAVLSYAVCAACFKNRMCSIRDRNHIVCIILILFCGSCCSWLFRGMYVFVCLYFAIIDLHWIEYGIDVMRSDAVLLLLLL